VPRCHVRPGSFVTNGNTTLSMRGRQNANNANTISQLTAPRVVRFGLRTTWEGGRRKTKNER